MRKNNATVKQAAKDTKPVIINQVTVRPLQRSNQEISKWKTAIRSADIGQRVPLLTLLENLLPDTRLSSVLEKRVMAITNSEWVFADENGKENDVIKTLIDTPAFELILEEVQNSVLFGHTLLEFEKDKNGNLSVYLIPRRHVKPEKGIVVLNENDTTGIDYKNAPYLLEAGKLDDYGLIYKAAPYVIFKNGNFSDWAQFCELFGIPQRVGEYDPTDPESKLMMEETLEQSGSAPFVAIPAGSSLKIVENSGNGTGETFERLKNACNEEITILILGQNMTTENGSSKAQGQVHMAVEESLHKKDRRRVRRILNERLIPVLLDLGYPVGKGKFSVKDESKLSTKERIEILDMVKANAPVDDDEYYEVSGVPKPANYDALKKEKQTTPPPSEPTTPKPTPAPDKKKVKKDKVELSAKNNFFEKLKSFFDKAE